MQRLRKLVFVLYVSYLLCLCVCFKKSKSIKNRYDHNEVEFICFYKNKYCWMQVIMSLAFNRSGNCSIYLNLNVCLCVCCSHFLLFCYAFHEIHKKYSQNLVVIVSLKIALMVLSLSLRFGFFDEKYTCKSVRFSRTWLQNDSELFGLS